jgi:hypothetical protein
VINTIEISRKLQASGLTQKQAEAIAESMLQIPDWANLVTNADLAELRMASNIAELHAATKTDIAELRSELRTLVAETKTSIIYWVIGSVGLSTIVSIGASFLHH